MSEVRHGASSAHVYKAKPKPCVILEPQAGKKLKEPVLPIAVRELAPVKINWEIEDGEQVSK